MLRVLLIEDDGSTVESIRLCLEMYRPGSALTYTEKGTHGVELARDGSFDVVMLDLGLPDIDGVMLIEQLRNAADTPILVISARHSPEVIARCLELGAVDYIMKPFTYQRLLERLDRIAVRQRMSESEGR